MSTQSEAAPNVASPSLAAASRATLPILLALSFSHLLNDMLQSLVPAIYPVIKESYALDYGQIGLITFTFQMCASVFQPLVGLYADHRPRPYSLVVGMSFSLFGLLVLAFGTSYLQLVMGAALIGTGSSIYHPEATRVARMASGGRYGFAQSVFQVGGHTGTAIGPLLAAFIVVPFGQTSLAWFALAALLALFVMLQIGHWYKAQAPAARRAKGAGQASGPSRTHVAFAIFIIVLLMMSKSAYSASFNSYYTFYLLGKFHVSVQTSQLMLFLFLLATPLGTMIGGHLGDVIGRRQIIWFSILGACPFTLALPYVDSVLWTGVLTVIIGMIMASAIPALLVYAMELLPGRLGFVAGIFYGLAFGLGALAAALLGELADYTSIDFVYHVCAFLPFLGLLTWFLPPIGNEAKPASH